MDVNEEIYGMGKIAVLHDMAKLTGALIQLVMIRHIIEGWDVEKYYKHVYEVTTGDTVDTDEILNNWSGSERDKAIAMVDAQLATLFMTIVMLDVENAGEYAREINESVENTRQSIDVFTRKRGGRETDADRKLISNMELKITLMKIMGSM